MAENIVSALVSKIIINFLKLRITASLVNVVMPLKS